MSKRKKLAKGCGWTLAAGAVAALATMFLWADFPMAAMRFNGAEERARNAGVPITLQELRPGPPIPPELNAAQAYDRIFARSSRRLSEDLAAMQVALGEGGLGPREALRVAARQSQRADELYQASLLPYYDLEVDLDHGFPTLMREHSFVKVAAQFFSYRGIAHAKVGQAEEATRDLATAIRIGLHVAQDRSLISALVACATHGIALNMAQRAAEQFAQNPEALALLEKEVLAYDVSLDFRSAMQGEAYLAIAMIRNMDVHTGMHPALVGIASLAMGDVDQMGMISWVPPTGGRDMPFAGIMDPTKIRRSGKPPGWILQGFLARTLEGWAAFFEALPESGATMEDFKEAHLRKERALDNHRLSFSFARLFQTAFASSHLGFIRADADAALARTYVDVLQFRNEHGRWPESVAEAGVQTPDPFDGQPLRIRVEGDRFLLWSVGPDLTDDGGKTRVDLLANYPNAALRAPNRPAEP